VVESASWLDANQPIPLISDWSISFFFFLEMNLVNIFKFLNEISPLRFSSIYRRFLEQNSRKSFFVLCWKKWG
jgi:predicted GTPase